MEDFLVYLGAVLFVVCIIVGFILLASSGYDGLDARCKAQFGNDYSYTSRTATDCINSNGEGKFLKRR